MSDSTLTHFELRFQSLFNSGRGYAFPCDSTGHVDLNELSEHARNNYFYARAVVGRELATPAVRPKGCTQTESVNKEGEPASLIGHHLRSTISSRPRVLLKS